jgi:hypothetical protein
MPTDPLLVAGRIFAREWLNKEYREDWDLTGIPDDDALRSALAASEHPPERHSPYECGVEHRAQSESGEHLRDDLCWFCTNVIEAPAATADGRLDLFRQWRDAYLVAWGRRMMTAPRLASEPDTERNET